MGEILTPRCPLCDQPVALRLLVGDDPPDNAIAQEQGDEPRGPRPRHRAVGALMLAKFGVGTIESAEKDNGSCPLPVDSSPVRVRRSFPRTPPVQRAVLARLVRSRLPLQGDRHDGRRRASPARFPACPPMPDLRHLPMRMPRRCPRIRPVTMARTIKRIGRHLARTAQDIRQGVIDGFDWLWYG